jgi:hypothetical protein
MTALEDYVKNTSRFVQPFVLVAVAGSLMVVLAACNGSSARRTASTLSGTRRPLASCRTAGGPGRLAGRAGTGERIASLYIRTDRRRSTDLHQGSPKRSDRVEVPDRPSSLRGEILVKPNANGTVPALRSVRLMGSCTDRPRHGLVIVRRLTWHTFG